MKPVADPTQPSLLAHLPPAGGQSWTARCYAAGRNTFGGYSGGSFQHTFTWPVEPTVDDPALIDYLASQYIDTHYYTERIEEIHVYWVRPADEEAGGGGHV